MARIKESEIQFLALEGGGGKGAAFLGAIQYLEKKVKILPVNLDTPGKNKIKGISGASAGALTALLLAVGYSSAEIEQVLGGKKMPWGGSYDFRKFLDSPFPGTHIVLTKENITDLETKFWYEGNNFDANITKLKVFNRSDIAQNIISIISLLFDISNRLNIKDIVEAYDTVVGIDTVVAIDKMAKAFVNIKNVLNVDRGTKVPHLIILMLNLLIFSFFEIVKKNPNFLNEIKEYIEKLNLTNLIKEPTDYLYSLLFNNGMLLGIEPILFFYKAIEYKIGNRIPYSKSKFSYSLFEKPHIGNLNFKMFYKITGVDLVFTGTNITKGVPAFFSYRHTPLMPVILAARISMGLPVIYRPIYINSKVVKNEWNPDEEYYKGEWIDGGFLNNLPLHAFDFYPKKNPNENNLNPNIIGIRLTEPEVDQNEADSPFFFLTLLGKLVNTLLYPSEGGQIRNTPEKDQTIDIDTGALSTLEFSSPPEVLNSVKKKAYQKMYEYFNPGMGGLDSPF